MIKFLKRFISDSVNKGKINQNNLDSSPVDIKNHILLALKLLKIDCPIIEYPALIFESRNQVVVQKKIDKQTVPQDASFYGAYQLNNLVLVAKYTPTFVNNKIDMVEKNNAELFFFLLHELRHIWQEKYHKDIYGSKNAIGYEVIEDIAEIDADAFALSFFFSDKIPYNHNDLPNSLNQIFLHATVDGGKRFERVLEISKEINLECKSQIDEAIEHVDKDYIRQNVFIMKLNGYI